MSEQPVRRFDARAALVTGAGSGMGREYALLLAERGCAVAVNDVRREAAEETIELGRQFDVPLLAVPADVSDGAAVADMVARVERELGRLDVLINNAGIPDREVGLLEVADEQWRRTFSVHVDGTFFCSRAAVPGMKRRRYGRILNVASRWALAGNETAHDYIAAKAAIMGFTKGLAKELGPFGITVNAIAPGGVFTGMTLRHPLERLQAEEKLTPLGRWSQP